MPELTKSQQAAADIAALLRARTALIWVVSKEEQRVEQYILEAAASANYGMRTWDVSQGCLEADGALWREGAVDVSAMLGQIRLMAEGRIDAKSQKSRFVWVMRDLPIWLQGLPGAEPSRALRNLARLLPTVPRGRAQSILVLSPTGEVPPELSGHATVLNWPLPDRTEIAGVIDAAINALPADIKEQAATPQAREQAIDSAVGLTGEEAAGCIAKSIVQLKRIDAAHIAQEKKRLIAKERVLEWHDPLPGGMDAVGGLHNLKVWLKERATAYSPAARDYGLPAPKGILLVGIPGCGKSLTAKGVASTWGVPLLRMDLGALKSKYVGESESNLRKAFGVIEAIGRCVVWLDEIEKALQGATSGSADGGVSADALGATLNWMQERSGEAFLIATSNDVTALPPEFLRKGRFDENWYVDLPAEEEIVEIIIATLRSFKRGALKLNWRRLAQAWKGFTGAEIAALVPDAMYKAFNDGKREITEDDLFQAGQRIVPMSKSAEKRISALRNWGKSNARSANSDGGWALEAAPAASNRFNVDL